MLTVKKNIADPNLGQLLTLDPKSGMGTNIILGSVVGAVQMLPMANPNIGAVNPNLGPVSITVDPDMGSIIYNAEPTKVPNTVSTITKSPITISNIPVLDIVEHTGVVRVSANEMIESFPVG